MVRDYRKQLVAAEEELAQLRALDPVTGAGTYSQLKASLDAEIARARRYGRPAAALLFGLRRLPGRCATSSAARSATSSSADLAQAIRDSLRGADRLFRMDVDEFVVLLPETDLAARASPPSGWRPARATSSPKAPTAPCRPRCAWPAPSSPSPTCTRARTCCARRTAASVGAARAQAAS